MADGDNYGRGMRTRSKRPVYHDMDSMDSSNSDPEPPRNTGPVPQPIPSLLNAIQEDQFKDPAARCRSRSRSNGKRASRRPLKHQPPTPMTTEPFPELVLTPEAQFSSGMTNLQGELAEGLGRRALEGPQQFPPGGYQVPPYTGLLAGPGFSLPLDNDTRREVCVETIDGELMAYVDNHDQAGQGRYYKIGPGGQLEQRKGKQPSTGSSNRKKSKERRSSPGKVFRVPDETDDETDDAIYALAGPSKPRPGDETVQAYVKGVKGPKDEIFQKHLRDSKDQTIQKYFRKTASGRSWFPSWVPIVRKSSKAEGVSSSAQSVGRPRGRSLPSRPVHPVRRGWLAPIWDTKDTLDGWLHWWWLRVPAALYLLDKWLWNVYLFFDPYQDTFGEEPEYIVLGVNLFLITALLRADRPFLSALGTLFGWGMVVHGFLRRWLIAPLFRVAQWMCIIGTIYVIFLAHIAVGVSLWNFFVGGGGGGGGNRSERMSMAEQGGIPRYMVKAARMFGFPLP